LSFTRDRNSYASSSSIASTPDLTSDFSDAITESSAPSSPPSFSPSSHKDEVSSSNPRHSLDETTDDKEAATFSIRNTPTPKCKAISLPHNDTAPSLVHSNRSCDKCGGALFTTKDGGKFVTVPEEPTATGTPMKTYHSECFRCSTCQGTFRENAGGQAVFVRKENGACHPEVSIDLYEVLGFS
jgi:hypothetical protein